MTFPYLLCYISVNERDTMTALNLVALVSLGQSQGESIVVAIDVFVSGIVS